MPIAPSAPSPDQVLQVPSSSCGTVEEDWIDRNGDMDIRHYLDIGALATDQVVRAAGIDDDCRADRRMGVFTALLALIMDRTHGRLACLFETVLVHVDLQSRSSTAFPEDVTAAYDRLQAEDRARSTWPAPVCGILGPTRRSSGDNS
ncbi:thioesterase family protein [Citricoccus sp. I39-566]|uniref:thioesterase family protein n=1 Tax=Citricoccus sp. I39-566 TaxID=3073268 RepID=UPI00286B3703|nr:thioesterase family protein [Citricoccus sp. I39-566]WMY79235.1 thioesterase family protein [Citricoccus sp. I39-566]